MSEGLTSDAVVDEASDAFYAALLADDPEVLYEQAPCGYLSTTPSGTIIKVNRTFLLWSGYSRQDLVARRTFAELLTPGGRIYHETHYAPMLQMQGTAREIALDIVSASGERLPALVNSVLERDGNGSPVVVRTAVFDATQRRRYERELIDARRRAEASEAAARRLAATLQQTLIPPAPPEIPGLDAAAAYRPAGNGEEVGGDFYDVFQLAEDDWIVTIGDVCGKGVEAALVTALARHTIRAAAVGQSQLQRVLETLNGVLLRHESERFCTVALVRLRRTNDIWHATVASGGHPVPLVLGTDGTIQSVGRTGPLLGVLEQVAFPTRRLALDPGAVMLLYTDGVTEARAGPAFLGEEGVVALLRDHPGSAQQRTDALLAQVLAYQGGDPHDDVAIVVLRVP